MSEPVDTSAQAVERTDEAEAEAYVQRLLDGQLCEHHGQIVSSTYVSCELVKALRAVKHLIGERDEQVAINHGDRHLLGIIAHALGVTIDPAKHEGPQFIEPIEALQSQLEAAKKADWLVRNVHLRDGSEEHHAAWCDVQRMYLEDAAMAKGDKA